MSKRKSAKEIIEGAGLQFTKWGKRIIRAEARGQFTAYDECLATDWTTCACGSQDKRIPIGAFGPYDYSLNRLGMGFTDAVFDDQIRKAARLLVAIERRAGILLARIARKEAKK